MRVSYGRFGGCPGAAACCVECPNGLGISNAAGLCQNCNHAKQAPGWIGRLEPSSDLVIGTPTGHRYRSRAPDPPGGSPAHRTFKDRPIIVDFVHARIA